MNIKVIKKQFESKTPSTSSHRIPNGTVFFGRIGNSFRSTDVELCVKVKSFTNPTYTIMRLENRLSGAFGGVTGGSGWSDLSEFTKGIEIFDYQPVKSLEITATV